MAEKVEFELRTEHAEVDGVSVALPDGKTYDVQDALEEGHGVLSVHTSKPEGQTLAGILDGHFALKRTSPKSAEKPVQKAGDR